MASWGCPRGWYSGWRYQYTEHHRYRNKKSRWLERKMRIHVLTKYICTYYCVKIIKGESRVQWPRGTYCTAKKGKCPRGFFEGGIKWDDKNRYNKNHKWGILPDGKYNWDTIVKYCCRSDLYHHFAMVLPTKRPFILYRYGGHCQHVRGMRYTQIWVKWHDENRRNRNKCWGAHPDSNCHKDLILNMCYYHR